jgi:hypothetical protein
MVEFLNFFSTLTVFFFIWIQRLLRLQQFDFAEENLFLIANR